MSRELFDAPTRCSRAFAARSRAPPSRLRGLRRHLRLLDRHRATFSKVAIPEMRRHGYNDIVAAGSVAAAGTLASSSALGDPRRLLVVAEQSLAKLFAAALFPGILLAALYVVAVWSRRACGRNGCPGCRRCPCASACAPRAACGSSSCSSSSR